MRQQVDVAILGGGVIGLTTAYCLAKAGARVAIADRGDLGQESSWAGAGIITPGNPKRARTPLGQLKARGAALLPELSAELRERTGLDNGYIRCGGLELRRSADALERQRFENLLREERGEGLHCDVLDGTELHRVEPQLAPELPGGILYPEMAQVRNPRHVKALIAACVQLGVEMHIGCPIHALGRSGDRITEATFAGGALLADRYLIAAGAWSDALLQPLGWPAHIRPVRGQIALLKTPAPVFRHILQAGSEYLVPRADGRVLIGSTEEEVGFDKRTTAAAIQHLLRLAVQLVPALADAHLERCWAGLRPGNPDGKPILGRVPETENLFVAAGHFRTGIHLSGITGLLMSELLLDKPLTMPLEAFRLERLREATVMKS